MQRLGIAAVPVMLLLTSAAMAQDSAKVLTGEAAASSDWKTDAPGVRRLITPDDLAAPGLTPSATNWPATIAQPAGATPKVPAGFKAEMVASGIENPRAIRFAPNGDLFVSNSSQNQVLVYRFADGGAKPVQESVFASDQLSNPYGIAFYPSGDSPQWVYIANDIGLVRFPYKSGDLKASAPPEVLFSDIPPQHHWTRDVVFSPDGKTMYYSVGSGSNVGLDPIVDASGKYTVNMDATMEATPAGGLEAWIKDHPLGLAWGGEEDRAAVLALDPDGKNRRVFATGLRNCAGMTLQPATGQPWCVVNERDELGDNVPFDYATEVEDGAFYGWPWFYIGDHPDPRWAQTPRDDLKDLVTVPEVLFQTHSAPLNIVFYDSDAWGADYQGDAFVTLHGSWNRGSRTGYKVVKLDFGADGNPTGVYEDFMTGFVLDAANVWGRPVGVAVSPDGALFVSEDGNGTIWKISHE